MEYDYLIVGAGSAGCVLAERLSADASKSVLLLEAGPADRSPFVHIPKGFANLLGDPAHVHFIPTTATVDTPAETWVRGKLLGGSSSVNGMMYFRGHPEDYEDWVRLGATGWGWAAMGQAFREIEDHELGAGGGRGVGGPLRISVCPRRYELAERFIRAGQEMGIARVADLNHAGQDGVGYATRTIWRGRRQSAAQAFLAPARSRRNLRIETGVHIDRVEFVDRRAVAVQGRARTGSVRFAARGEIILAAGGLFTPQILQRSGVGPAALLRGLGIDVVADSPAVGAHMLEHRLLMLHYALKRPLSINPELRGWRLVRTALRYALNRSGPLADGSYDVGAFVRTAPDLQRPDAEVLMAPYGYAVDDSGKPQPLTRHSFHLFGYPLRSRSVGSVRITSIDSQVPAAIQPNFLADPYDRAVTCAMFRLLRRWLRQEAIAEIIGDELAPGADIASDEQIVAAFRARGNAGYHACGTVRMGSDAQAPLTPELRVRGVEGLRVVDGSVMPAMVSANTNGPIMALAWHAAKLIRGERIPAA